MTESRFNGFEKLISAHLGNLEGYRAALSRRPGHAGDASRVSKELRRITRAAAFAAAALRRERTEREKKLLKTLSEFRHSEITKDVQRLKEVLRGLATAQRRRISAPLKALCLETLTREDRARRRIFKKLKSLKSIYG